MHREQRDQMGWFSTFFEGVGEPGEAPVVLPHGEVLALDIGSADVLRIGRAFDPRPDDASAFGGAVTGP